MVGTSTLSKLTSCCGAGDACCDARDLLEGLAVMRVIVSGRRPRDASPVTVESLPSPMGCPACAMLAVGHGRVTAPLADAPAMGRRTLLGPCKQR